MIETYNNLNPILLNEPFLPSFASLRERNLKTLYDGGSNISDRSPKGSVDEKIRPLVNLINLHPEFVTLSSCSGRVALFDPTGCDDRQQLLESCSKNETITLDEHNNTSGTTHQQKVKGTEISGKGRGKWIFVTHDILPDLGEQIIYSLRQASKQRRQILDTNNNSVITFKHEPPLLHIAASSLDAGKKLLHLAKSTCAMRESGLVVTDQRVTVELRTTATSICLPIMVQLDETLQPEEVYLMALANVANKRMEQNMMLLEKLFHTIRSDFFEDRLRHTASNHDFEDCSQFVVSIEPLPSLNLWKSASVVINRTNYDIDILSFGGQGTGPSIDEREVSDNNTKASPCRRWDGVFRLSRMNGAWAKSWRRISTANKAMEETTLGSGAGSFQVNCKTILGAREGHTACILPSLTSPSKYSEDLVVIFGGRTGGPTTATNDIFLFLLQDDDKGILGKPVDIRGSPPIPRYGHSMNTLMANQSDDTAVIAVMSGGHSGEVALSCIYILSRSVDRDTDRSHLFWERIADMLKPRCYHAATVIQTNGRVDALFVFGGTSEPDDPFSSVGQPCFKQPIHRANNVEHSKDIAFFNDFNFPKLIGAAVCSCHLQSENNNMMLLSGGVQDHDSNVDEPPFQIIKWKIDASGAQLYPERARYSVTGCGHEFDLGAMVHHNLLLLPSSSNASISAALVGGGVPSFSFGQSFARSFEIKITASTIRSRKGISKTFIRGSQTKVETKHIQIKNSRNITDVVYVAPSNAKAVRLELEKLGYFDSRHKMVKVERKENDGKKVDVIGLPITLHFKSLFLAEGEGALSVKLESAVIGLGEEAAPFSSSQMSKFANKAH